MYSAKKQKIIKNSKKTLWKLFLLISAFILLHSHADSSVGTKAGNFLKVGIGARSIGFAESYVSLADDPSSLYWNPAGLSIKKESSILFAYNKWLENISHGFAGIDLGESDWGTLGFGLTYMSTGDITAYDQYDSIIGSTIAKDVALQFALARKLTLFDHLIHAGITYKYLNQTLDDTTATGHGIDIGFISSFLKDNLSIGLCIQNALSTKIKFYKAKENLFRSVRLGTAYKGFSIYERNIILSAQVDFDEEKTKWSTGTEIEIHKPLVVRAGYRSRDIGTGISLGFGIKVKDINIDYAFTNHGDFNSTHMLSLSLGIPILKGGPNEK
ncbi:PorV/PorQ family protein [bacterium]